MFEKLAERIYEIQSAMQTAEHGHEIMGLDGTEQFVLPGGYDALPAEEGEMLADLLATYDYSAYPDRFTRKYVITECLAERNGIDTFVVQDNEGEKYVAKCYDRSIWSFENDDSILRELSGSRADVQLNGQADGMSDGQTYSRTDGLPKYIGTYSNDRMIVRVREYIEGISLDKYAAAHELSREQITDICMQLCDILARLHHREEPVIHRDIKPQNIIVRLAETESWAEEEEDLPEGTEGAVFCEEAEEHVTFDEGGTRNADDPADEAGSKNEEQNPAAGNAGKAFDAAEEAGPEAESPARAVEKIHIALIDFDIARVYNKENDTDTRFFGTVAYAPPEQYGFSQTDARADIYSLGVLLRFLLTGSSRENKNVSVYKPLAKIIDKCTAFSPEDRYSDIDQVKKALSKANPGAQRIRLVKIIACCLLAAILFGLTAFQIYKAVTWSPFNDDAIPAFTSDSERVDDAVEYMNNKFNTDLFSGVTGTLGETEGSDSVATIGLLKKVLIDCYGLDADYVNAPNTEMPHESDEFFLPWTWDDSQTIGRGSMVYVAVKLYDPKLVADWSSLEDDNGEYPGERVAIAFAEETGIMTGVNRPDDLTVGEMALILANTDRVFAAAEDS